MTGDSPEHGPRAGIADEPARSPERARVACIPPRLPGNPYLDLVYGPLEAEGIGRVPDAALTLRRLRRDRGAVSAVHLHWPEGLYRWTRPAPPGVARAAAWAKLALFAIRLGAARALGYRVVWTIHQPVPHESVQPRLDLVAARLLARAATALIAHDAATAARAEALLPAARGRIRIAPHGSYVDVYPRGESRAEARRRLGIPGDAFVFVSFGEVRRHKDLGLLLRAFAGLARRNCVLVVAGHPKDAESAAAVLEAAQRDPRVVPVLRFVPDGEVAPLLGACDCAVLPRGDGGTSGALALALSLGLPVIAADTPATTAVLRSAPCGWLFAAGSTGSLARAMALAAASPAAAAARGADAALLARRLDWRPMTATVAEAVAPVPRLGIVCLSSQEWAVDLPTNRQQVMRRAAAAGNEVEFVETGGFLGRHLAALVTGPRRASLLRRLTVGERAAPGLRVRKSPAILPWGQRHEAMRRVNAALTTRTAARLAVRLPGRPVLWAFDPCALGRLRGPRPLLVYDCVDDYAEQVGPDRRRRALVADSDTRAGREADVVLATTEPLARRHGDGRSGVHLVGNAADVDHFAGAKPDPSLAELPRPVVGFAGNLLPDKVDLDLLLVLATARPDWTLLVAGPVRPGARELVEALAARANVHVLGPVPYGRLPSVVAVFDVALIPYRASRYTESCFPLKVYESLAAGKPVVATGLPGLAGLEPDVALAEGPDEVVARIETALRAGAPEDAARRVGLAAHNSWDAKTARELAIIHEAIAARDAGRAAQGGRATPRPEAVRA